MDLNLNYVFKFAIQTLISHWDVLSKHSVLQTNPVEDPIVRSSSGRLSHGTELSLRGHCSLGHSPPAVARPLHHWDITWKNWIVCDTYLWSLFVVLILLPLCFEVPFICDCQFIWQCYIVNLFCIFFGWTIV